MQWNSSFLKKENSFVTFVESTTGSFYSQDVLEINPIILKLFVGMFKETKFYLLYIKFRKYNKILLFTIVTSNLKEKFIYYQIYKIQQDSFIHSD